MFLIPDVCSSAASIFSFIMLTKKLQQCQEQLQGHASIWNIYLRMLEIYYAIRAYVKLGRTSTLDKTNKAEKVHRATLSWEVECVGAGSVRGRSSRCSYASYHHTNATDIWHVGGKEGTLDPAPPHPVFRLSLSARDIWHLRGRAGDCFKLQNGPVRFLCRCQSPRRIPDWLIPLAIS